MAAIATKSVKSDSDVLFEELEQTLIDNIDDHYFGDTKEFKSLTEVLEILGEKIISTDVKNLFTVLKEENPAYSRLLEQRDIVTEVIEGVVTFQHGGLNNSMDTMSAVVHEYNKGREDIKILRDSLLETKDVLTAKKIGQISLKELWSNKVEIEQSLRIIKDIEALKDANLQINRLISQKKFLSAVLGLNRSLELMFNEDLIHIAGLIIVREQLLNLKEFILEKISIQLQDIIIGDIKEANGYDSDDEAISDCISQIEETTASSVNEDNFARSSQYGDSISVLEDESPHRTSYRSPSNILKNQEESLIKLLEIDLTFENNLATSSNINNINYLLLLIKSVGYLRCEDDVERMILDNLNMKFNNILYKLKLISTEKKDKKIKTLNKTDIYEKNKSSSAQFQQDKLFAIESKLFVFYIESLLNSAVDIVRHALFIIKLLFQSKKNDNREIRDNKNYINDNTKKAVLTLWKDIEEVIVKELTIHFVDLEVIAISNIENKKASNLSFFNCENDEIDNCSQAIFQPSVCLAPPVYKLIMSYNDNIMHILNSEHVFIIKNNYRSQYNDNVSTIEDDIESEYEKEFKKIKVSKILVETNNRLDCDFLPIIQRNINKLIRDLQTNSKLFTISNDNIINSKTNPNNDPLSLKMKDKNDKDTKFKDNNINQAAKLCVATMTPLFSYWYQLPLHRDTVATILENLIKGFTSAVSEEINGLTNDFISNSTEFYSSSLLTSINSDSMLAINRQKLYHGNNSIDEIISGRGNNSSNTMKKRLSWLSMGSVTSIPGIGQTSVNYSYWGEFWNMTGVPYAISSDQIRRDFTIISSLSSILLGCDWLSMQLISICNELAKKFNINSENVSHGSNKHTPLSTRISMKFQPDVLKQGRQESYDIQQPLWKIIQTNSNELSQLAVLSMSLIRGELQISCFYFLHKLAYLKTHIVSSNNNESSNNSNDVLQESQAIITNFYNYILKFINAVLISSNTSVLPVIISPLSSIVPRITMNCVINMINNIRKTDRIDSINDNSGGVHKISRVLVSIQQCVNVIYENSSLDTYSSTTLQEKATLEFDHVRNYISLLEVSIENLKNYICDHVGEYTQEEYKVLWLYTAARFNDARDFEEITN